MKKNVKKNGTGILLLLGLICVIFTANTLNVSSQEKEDDVFVVVEDMPKFKDGDFKAFRTWVMQNVKYPEAAKKNGIKGTEYVEYIVEKDGSVSNVKVIKTADPILKEEALRVVKSSPKWTAGKQNGKLVRVKCVVPIVFALN